MLRTADSAGISVVHGGEDVNYTIGLSAKGLPDLLVFGLPQEASGIVGDIAQMMWLRARLAWQTA